jgi:hypothetical protein
MQISPENESLAGDSRILVVPTSRKKGGRNGEDKKENNKNMINIGILNNDKKIKFYII